MSVLHVSITADSPERVARFLATLMDGSAHPFPPFPDSWIAFAQADDGAAVEVYPLTHRLAPGESAVRCDVGAPDVERTFCHAAICSPHASSEILKLAAEEGWTARRCDRGPFACVEIWIEERLLIEALDPTMQRDYRKGMTRENWVRMFGLNES